MIELRDLKAIYIVNSFIAPTTLLSCLNRRHQLRRFRHRLGDLLASINRNTPV